ncbi:hypothetical protein BC833DRAFT_531547, partial [Globomyces pollinis-pini]
FVVTLEIRCEGKSVTFVEIKSANSIESIFTRKQADKQMRERFELLAEECPLPILIGFSIIGTKVCTYSMDTGSKVLTPFKICEDNSGRIQDLAPKSFWNLDISNEIDFDQFIKQHLTIKEMCSNV